MSIQEKLQNIENENLNSIIDLSKLIEKYRFDENCKFAIPNNYSIEGVCRTFREPSRKISIWEAQNSNNEFYDIFFREHTGIILLYKKNPQAIISFKLIRNDNLYLTQLKGINLLRDYCDDLEKISDPIGLRYIDSISLMYSIFFEYAKNLVVKKISIQSLKNRSCDDFMVNSNLEWKLLKIFDEIPFWMDFKQESSGDWFKEIKDKNCIFS